MNLIEARYPTILAVGILLAGLSAFATVTATAAEQGTTSYKWTDEKGVLHYGDRVPPEHSKRERSSLNEQGVEVGRFEAERTFEQLAEEERRTEEARRVASHDVFLRATYASVREIERLQQFGDRLWAEGVAHFRAIDRDFGDLSLFRGFVTDIFKLANGCPHGGRAWPAPARSAILISEGGSSKKGGHGQLAHC
jgi:hypothetical protein